MPEMTENASRPHKPQRKKNKETHNAVERHRKKKINAGINRIGELLPCSQALKQSKNMILDQAYRYITELKQQNDTLLLNGGDKVQAEEIRRLRRQLDELRKESAHYMELLKANGINFLDDPTVHWKGRLGRTRLSKVTPAHLVPEGIIVYSNGNVLCPAGDDPAASSQITAKRSDDIIANQPACSVAPASRTKFCLQDPPASPAAQLVPVPGLVAVEQHASDTHVISKLPGAVSYIAVPAVCPLSATSLATPQPSISMATHGPAPQVTLPLGPLTVPTLPSALGSTPQSQESALRTLALDSSAVVAPEQGPRSHSTVTLPQSVGDSHALRIGSTGSTQTTWTTLQLGPNSVQPFCHTIVSTASPTQTCNSTTQSLQGALMCPTGSVTSIQPVLAQAQVQSPPPVLGPPQGPVQTSMQVPLPPPVHVPLQSTAQAPLQATPTVLPLLQTMQVLQMRSSIAPPAPQTSSNTKVVILQPANPPAPQTVIREGLANQSSCQHIVIIQANNQNSLQQNSSVNGAPVAVPVTQQIVTSSCPASTTNVHTVGGKHLVHILPRPLAPPTSSPAPPMQAPQTITVNGQVFALQAVKPPAGSSVKTALQIVQPTTSEDPNTNVTLHTLGALANLNQSISHVSNQSLQLNVTPPAYPLAPIPFPVTTAAVNCSPALATSTTSVTSPVGGPMKVLLRKPGSTLAAKPKSRRPASKKGLSTKKMAPRQRDDSLPHPGMGAGQNLPAIEKQIQSTEPSTSTDMPERCSSTRSTEPALQQSEELNNAQCVTSTVGGTSGSGASSSASRPLVSTSGSPECIFAVSHMTLTLNGPTVTSESPAQSKSISSTAGSSECSKSVVIFTISGPTMSPVSEPVVSGATLTEFPPAVSCVSSSISRPIDSPVSSTVSKLLVTNDASTDGNHKVPSSSFTVTGLSLLTGTSVNHPLDLQDSLANERPALTVSSLANLTRPCSVFTSSPAPNVLPSLTECTKSTSPPQTVISPLEPTILSLASPQGNTVPTEPSMKNAGRDSDPSGHRVSDEGTDKRVPGGGEELSRKASAPPQHVCEMEQDTLGQPLLSSRQTESPVLAGPGGARGFSVASMLPPCHGVSAPGVSFATFTFTSEQAEILAMAARAIFEQDSPGRRSGSCGMESPTPGLASGLSSGPTSDWDLTKAQQTSHSKERSTGSQPKLPKASEITTARPLSEVSVESLEAPARELLAASYPQSSQAHSQSSHSPSAGSLSVNNLIRPTSSCQPYPCSPSLPQQVSAPSPVVPSMTQPPVLLPPCSASGQLSELTPSKTALMRATGAERRMKDLPKRTAQDDMLVAGSKRPKPCSANAVTRIDMKAVSSDHVQMMPGHPPASLGSSSAPSNRAHPTDGISPLFPGNSFMNTVLRQTDSHCSSQGLQQEHLQPSRSQHGNTGHHQTGNPYLKQQEQQQLQGQRQHLYQLQHHLIQPDPTQLHSLHQRVLQQDQHIQKKRGMVRGGQQAPIISLTQKQHHVEKNGVQHQQPQQQPQQQAQQQHHQQQQQQAQQQHHQQQQQQPQQHHQQQQQQPQQHHQQQQQQAQQQHHQQQQQQAQQQHHQQQQQQPQQHHQQQQQPPQQHHQQQQQQPQQHHQQQQQPPQQHHQQQQQPPQQQHHQQQQQQPQQHHQQSQHHQQQQQQAQQQHHPQQQQLPQQQHHQQQPQQQHHPQQQQLPQQQHHPQQQQLPQQQPHHQQQQPQPQASHSMHQHIQQHLQQQQQHFGSRHQEKSLLHPQQQPRQDQQVTQSHNVMQRLISSRSLEQQLTPQAGSTVSRSSDMTCAPSRQERHRISSYSAEALIGKSSSSGEQRLGLPLQAPRSAQDQSDMRPYLDVSRGKGTHNPQGRLPPEHPGPGDLQRVSECAPFKALSGGQHTLASFEAQASKPGPAAHRAVQTQGFRMGSSVAGDRQPRGPYPGQQGVPVGTGVQRDHESCQQSFMQSLLVPQVEQVGHQRAPQCCPPVSMDYGCVSGTPGGDLQAKAGSPSVPPVQKPPAMRLSDTSKGHINAQIGGNMHSGGVRAGLHPPTSHSSAESTLPAAPPTVARPLNAVSQRSRHLGPDSQSGKLRPTERSRPSTLRPGNPFESEGHLALPAGGGVLLGRQQPGGDARRGSIVRFMADSVQVGSDGLVSDQHLAQNFGFSFIPDNAPGINTNPTFMPPVSQSSTSRTPSILPVEPQAPLSSFYPSYSPAAHPSLPSDIQLQYFPNQMFSSPNTEKAPGPPLNNRFGSILSPPRPVGFAQASFPLLTDMPPMPITNSSAITPHLSNFNLTSLFPEIATAMPADGSTMPMSPLLSLSNTSSSDSGKQPNRPAHNISHILGHDGTSAI